jgi:hypothetical protein
VLCVNQINQTKYIFTARFSSPKTWLFLFRLKGNPAMALLLNFPWIKLPRDTLPPGKGLMGSWVRLAARAAIRPGQAVYCGHRNNVELASWVGGIVGLKSILDINNRQKAMTVMEKLSELGYVSYSLDKTSKKLSYTIKDWVVECSGAACADGAVYTTEGYGFLCLPRNITQRLAEAKCKFEESDAWLDLWCHTVWQDFRNAFSYSAPVIQFGSDGAALRTCIHKRFSSVWKCEILMTASAEAVVIS